jgi:MFS family permease
MDLVTERNRKWWVVIAMAITTLLMTIDFNGLTVALPTIGRDLDTSTTGLQWTINAYLLAFAAPSLGNTFDDKARWRRLRRGGDRSAVQREGER